MAISLRGLDPQTRAAAEYALEVARAYKIPVTVTSGYRSIAEQTTLRNRYEGCLARGERVHAGNPNPDCRYPANRPGASTHNYGFSFDSWVPEGYWAAWNYIRSAIGFKLDSNDRVHAEHPQAWQIIGSR